MTISPRKEDDPVMPGRPYGQESENPNHGSHEEPGSQFLQGSEHHVGNESLRISRTSDIVATKIAPGLVMKQYTGQWIHTPGLEGGPDKYWGESGGFTNLIRGYNFLQSHELVSKNHLPGEIDKIHEVAEIGLRVAAQRLVIDYLGIENFHPEQIIGLIMFRETKGGTNPVPAEMFRTYPVIQNQDGVFIAGFNGLLWETNLDDRDDSSLVGFKNQSSTENSYIDSCGYSRLLLQPMGDAEITIMRKCTLPTTGDPESYGQIIKASDSTNKQENKLQGRPESAIQSRGAYYSIADVVNFLRGDLSELSNRWPDHNSSESIKKVASYELADRLVNLKDFFLEIGLSPADCKAIFRNYGYNYPGVDTDDYDPKSGEWSPVDSSGNDNIICQFTPPSEQKEVHEKPPSVRDNIGSEFNFRAPKETEDEASVILDGLRYDVVEWLEEHSAEISAVLGLNSIQRKMIRSFVKSFQDNDLYKDPDLPYTRGFDQEGRPYLQKCFVPDVGEMANFTLDASDSGDILYSNPMMFVRGGFDSLINPVVQIARTTITEGTLDLTDVITLIFLPKEIKSPGTAQEMLGFLQTEELDWKINPNGSVISIDLDEYPGYVTGNTTVSGQTIIPLGKLGEDYYIYGTKDCPMI